MGSLADWQLILLSSIGTGSMTVIINKLNIKFIWQAIRDMKSEHIRIWDELKTKQDKV